MTLLRLFQIGLLTFPAMTAEIAHAEDPISFNHDIRPILSQHCFRCHGHDGAARKAGFRLDVREDVVDRAGLIVPGDAEASVLFQRIHAIDEADRMPPLLAKKPLNEKQKALLTRWINAGAEYEPHWSFVPVQHIDVPLEGENLLPIDSFIAARLREEGLAPQALAMRENQLRRASFDLTGLPPTPEELDVFLADTSAGAWETAIDKLMSSERYGEHMARFWLDAARYGDTHGLHLDNLRTMWKYRDWVINSFNENEPFDSFTIRQLAGDLLENPSTEDQIASGFIRCHVTTSEGGSIAEEYIVRYAVDRTQTAGTIWMGLTVGCAACHDHRYDPVSRREFYELFAFFNNTTENAMDGNVADTPPVLRVGSDEANARISEIATRRAAIAAAVARDDEKTQQAQAAWTKTHSEVVGNEWELLEPISIASTMGSTYARQSDGTWLLGQPFPATDQVDVVFDLGDGQVLRALRLDCLEDESLPYNGPGAGPQNGNFVLTELELAVGASPEGPFTPVKVERAISTHDQLNWPILEAIDGAIDPKQGWAILRAQGKSLAQSGLFQPVRALGQAENERFLRVRKHFASPYPGHSIGRFRFMGSRDPARGALELGTWQYSGAIGIASYTDGFSNDHGADAIGLLDDVDFTWIELSDVLEGSAVTLAGGALKAHYLARTIYSPRAQTGSVALGSDDGVICWLNGEEVHRNATQRGVTPGADLFDVQLREGKNFFVMKVLNNQGPSGFAFALGASAQSDDQRVPFAVELALATDEQLRSTSETERIVTHWRERVWPEGRSLRAEREELDTEDKTIQQTMVTTLVAAERVERRPAHMLARGEYDQKEDVVQPGTPAALPPFDPALPQNRLGFAKWLLDPNHPLTARVTVNRLWQQFFGKGLVLTSEDFGSQGESPSHPKLLDYLALDFVENGWDIQQFVKQLVMTETYRRSAVVTNELLERDPENRLFARGVRHRLDGESIRDMALFVSGLLVEEVGGAPVKPYQPAGIWKAVGYTRSNTANFTQDHGEALYRRSVYTFWKRTAPPPVLVTFDAPSREACSVRRERTNTPLQALATLNDITFVEAARFFAERMMRYAAASNDDAALVWGFRSVSSRTPTMAEREVLTTMLDDLRENYQAAPDQAAALLGVGEAPRDDTLDTVQHAAWTALGNVLLNLDEALTKG